MNIEKKANTIANAKYTIEGPKKIFSDGFIKGYEYAMKELMDGTTVYDADMWLPGMEDLYVSVTVQDADTGEAVYYSWLSEEWKNQNSEEVKVERWSMIPPVRAQDQNKSELLARINELEKEIKELKSKLQ